MPVGEPHRGSSTATPLNVSYRIGRIAHHLSGQWLDFGCADGGYVQEMLKRGAETVYGVDVEADRIHSAQRLELPNATFEVFDGNQLLYDEGTFDGS